MLLQAVNVLIVDDRAENLMALEGCLEGLGLTLVRASSGKDALRCLLEREFALILMDVQMPGLSGFETASLIKQRERTSHVPIIFLTAINKEERYVFEGYNVGAVDYLFKPFDPVMLRSKVGVFVELHRKSLALAARTEELHLAEQREHELAVAAALRESEQRYRNLAEAIPQIVWTADPHGRFTYFNRRWVEYTGIAIAAPETEVWQLAVHPEDVERDRQRWSDALASGEAVQFESRLRQGADGSYRWHLVQLLPDRAEDGRLVGWLGTCTDIDDRVRDSERMREHTLLVEAQVAERTQALAEALASLEAADRYKDEFLSVISHELRTPLNFIMGFASILEDEIAGPLGTDQRQYVNKILNGTDRMLILVNDLLDFAKIQAGEFELFPQSHAYAPLVDEVLMTLKPLADHKHIELQGEVAGDLVARCDPQRVIQILTNLVTNAIKFTPEGGIVHVVARQEGPKIVTEVEDTGIGIAPQDIEKLFMRFKQLDMSRTREAGGTGLGLCIAKALVEAHGGEIAANSSGLGHGANFHYTLPGAELPANSGEDWCPKPVSATLLGPIWGTSPSETSPASGSI